MGGGTGRKGGKGGSMKIEIKKTGAIFREVGKGEVFVIGSAVYIRTTGKEDEHSK